MLGVRSALWAITAAAALWAAPGISGVPDAPGAAVRGRTAFQSCAACHSDKPGVARVGPSLVGVFGGPAAQMKDFRYSAALSRAKLRWDRKTLDSFIARPRAVVPGTSMAYAGVTDPAKRRTIIDYLESLK